MICRTPQTPPWVTHLYERVAEANEIGLLEKRDELVLQSSIVFFPDAMESELINNINPACSIRDIQGSGTSRGWVKRDDLFEEAAMWICKNYCASERAELFCEAGYSKLGDKVLQKRPHIIFDGNPLLNQKLLRTSSSTIAQTLRWARSWRLLGVVAENTIDDGFDGSNVDRQLFICDAFDGDSVIATAIQNQGVGLVDIQSKLSKLC